MGLILLKSYQLSSLYMLFILIDKGKKHLNEFKQRQIRHYSNKTNYRLIFFQRCDD